MIGTIKEKINHCKTLPNWWGSHVRNQTELLKQLLIIELQQLDCNNIDPYQFSWHKDQLDHIQQLASSICRNLDEANQFELFHSAIGGKYDG